MTFKVHILGCGSASPSLSHQPACQVIEYNGMLYMIDCGEGAQLAFRRQGLSFARLRHIFISHLHGDHLLGLPGLLSTMALQNMEGEVHVYMLPEGIEIIRQIMATCAHTPSYQLIFHPITPVRQTIYENNAFTVDTFAMCHLIPAVGFMFREKPKKRHLRGDMVDYYNVPIKWRPRLRDGVDYVCPDGTVIPNERLTSPADAARSYAYCSDTLYNPGVVESVKGVDVLYHEATYGDDKADKAAARGHSTARQAGIAAQQAGAERLIIGHFSSSYTGRENVLLEQAQEVFPNTELANEGKRFTV